MRSRSPPRSPRPSIRSTQIACARGQSFGDTRVLVRRSDDSTELGRGGTAGMTPFSQKSPRKLGSGQAGPVGPANLQPAICSGQTFPGLQVESPPVQGAYEDVALDLAEHAQIGLPVWARPLHDVAPELDLLVRVRRVELAASLTLRAPHALDRQALEEVVQVLVERAVAPRSEAAAEEERVAPVDRTVGDDGLDQLTADVEA